jgi:hypothetical protein
VLKGVVSNAMNPKMILEVSIYLSLQNLGFGTVLFQLKPNPVAKRCRLADHATQ